MFKRMLVTIDGIARESRTEGCPGLAKDHEPTLYALHVVEDLTVAKGFDGALYAPAQFVDGMLASCAMPDARFSPKRRKRRCAAVGEQRPSWSNQSAKASRTRS